MAIRFTPETLLYQEFQIELHFMRDGLLSGRILRSPLGESGEFQVTTALSSGAIEEALASISYTGRDYLKRSAGNSSYDPIYSMGGALFTALFENTPVGRQWRAAQAMSEQRHEGLRLRLVLPDLEALNVPWEFLFDSFQGSPLALSTKTPVVRQRAPVTFSPLPVAAPLRVLVLVAEVTPRNAEQEIAFLQQLASASGMIEVTVVTEVTAERWQTSLAAQPYHVLHFIGASAWATGGGRWATTNWPLALEQLQHGLLVFDGKPPAKQASSVNAQLLPTQEIRTLLASSSELRLVILNAHDSDLVAAELAHTVPAVLGLRHKVSDQASTAIIGCLYEALVAGQALEAAVTQGRQAIDSRNPGTREWGLPVFYLNTPDGLFLRPVTEPAATIEKGLAMAMSATMTAELTTAEAGERQRLQSLIRIEEQTLATLLEQRAALGELTPPHIEEEIQATKARLTDLKRQ